MKKILYYIIYPLWYLASLMPLRIHYILSDIIYLIVCYVIRYRNKVIRNNLSTSFPGKSPEEIRQIQKKFYRWFSDYLVESVKLLTISEDELRRRMVFKGTDTVDEVVKSGQSCAVYLGHYCNWEWITSLPLWVCEEAQCGQIYHPLENEEFDRLFLRIRQRFGAVCIAMNDTLRKIIEYKRANKQVVIGYISDQVPFWNNIHHWTDFLNHDTPVLSGTERIARSADHAVFYLDVRRIKRGYYEAEFKLITKEPKKMAEFEITDIYFAKLEESIRRAPEFWLWSHNRWKRTREKFNKRFEVRDGKVYKKADAEQ